MLTAIRIPLGDSHELAVYELPATAAVGHKPGVIVRWFGTIEKKKPASA